ncbi:MULTISPECIES: hypothetical protein [Olivibacter]|uniref:Uncharacterized protein n=1 Tax=Olivibacter jilunii TaxID=985016 RepID=A0ABW6AYM0_9SPHI
MSNKTKETLAFLFARNKEVKTYYKTSDGQFFSDKERAYTHANDLKNKNVEPYSRSTYETVADLRALIANKAEKEQAEVEKTEKKQAYLALKQEQADKEDQEKAEQEAKVQAVKEAEEKLAMESLKQAANEVDKNAAKEADKTVELEAVTPVEVQEEKPVKATKGKTTKTTKTTK